VEVRKEDRKNKSLDIFIIDVTDEYQTYHFWNMKKSELRNLIREEIHKIAEADYTASYTHMEPFKLKIANISRQLLELNDEIEKKGPLSEEIVDAIESLGELISKINIQKAKG
jgi:hypothetical protein